MAKTDFKSIDEYLAAQTEDKRAALEHLRQLIRSIVPQAEEGISYQIPMFKYHGSLVGFAAHTNHCSFTTANATTLERFREALKGYKFSPSTVQFSPEKPLPDDLIRTIVQARVRENEEKRLVAGKNKRPIT